MIPKPTRELIGKLCQLGWAFKQITLFLSMDAPLGLISQSLLSCVEEELKEYTRLVCMLENGVEKHLANSGEFCSTALSLKRVWVWTRTPLFKLSVLLALLQVTQGKKGGEILSAIHKYVDHGDSVLNEYTTKLIAKISKPFYNMISSWIYQGDLEDPYGEFFVSLVSGSDGGTEDQWGVKYLFQKSMVPSYINANLSKKVSILIFDSRRI